MRSERRAPFFALLRTERGLIVQLEDATGARDVGEASPLLGFSPDSIDSVVAALSAWGGLRAGDLEPGLSRAEQVEGIRHAIQSLSPSSPAARFALETALLSRAARLAACRPWELLEPYGVAARPRLRSALIFGATAKDLGVAAGRALADGANALKIKLLGSAPDRELEAIEELRRSRPNVKIRLDANQHLNARWLDRSSARLRALALDFLEEPLPKGEIEALEGIGIPIGLDESLLLAGDAATSLCWSRLVLSGTRLVLVLKPMRLGGALRCLELAEELKHLTSRAVVSHMFDGPIAKSAYEALALILPGRDDDAMATGLGSFGSPA